MKNFLILLLILLLSSLCACGQTSEEIEPEDPRASAVQETNSVSLSGTTPAVVASDGKIEASIKKWVNALPLTKVDSLTVTSDYSTDAGDDYKVSIISTWKGEFSAEQSKQKLQEISSNMASTISSNLENVQSVSFVWLVPNLNGRANVAYTRTDGLLTLEDEAYDQKFGSDPSTTAPAIEGLTSDGSIQVITQ